MSYFKAIETKRLLLRKPETSDVFDLQCLWRNEIVRKYLGGIIEYKLIKEKIKSIQNHWDDYGFGLCVVTAKDSKQVMGLCGLHHSNDGVEISYMFYPKWWGKGIAREAIVAIMEYGFNNLKIKKIIAITQDANQRWVFPHIQPKLAMKLISYLNLSFISPNVKALGNTVS